ncbi:MAG: ATP-binding protein, partial [Bacteroidota bacterium]
PFLNYISESFQSLGSSNNIQLIFQAEKEALVMDYDPEMILRIVSNLLSNAIKYSESGRTVQMQVKKVPSPTEIATKIPACLSLVVKDEGIGISEKELPYIFDRFYQLDDSTTRKAEGTGIGLSLTKELIKLLGGKIGVRSTQGAGSTFMVHLPIHRSARLGDQSSFSTSIPTPIGLPLAATIPVTTPTTEKKDLPNLLIIEDNADVRQYLTICLDNHYQLSYAIDGAAGIEKALEEVPDIIISDVMMPQKDGFEVCDLLKKDVRTSHIPIILLTAKSDAESRIGGLQQGADAYLSKPFNEKELLVRLAKLLELRQTLQERYLRLGGKIPTEFSNARLEDDFIAKIQESIRANLSDETFGTSELCRSIGMSRTQLHNKLKALTGLSTSRYIRSIRIHEAKERLAKYPELNISDIAHATGFANLKYFSKIFSEEVGTSPSKYRKTYLSEQ